MATPINGKKSCEIIPLVTSSMTAKEIEKQNAQKKAGAKAVLLFVGGLYGSLDLGMKLLLLPENAPSPASACLVKTMIGMTAFAITVAVSKSDSTKERIGLLRPAISLAFWNIVSGAFMYEGIKRTTVSRAAILLQLSVVATPLLERIGLGRSQPAAIWIGAAIAFCGVSLLSYSPAATTPAATGASTDDKYQSDGTTYLGDLLVTMGAILWGWYLVVTAALPPSLDATALQGVKYGFSVIMYVIWAYTQHIFLGAPPVLRGWHSFSAWIWIIYIALVPGALSDVLQQRAQVLVRASEAGILLASEPVWATLLAIPVLGESLTSYEFIGGLLILMAAALISWAQEEETAPNTAVVQTMISDLPSAELIPSLSSVSSANKMPLEDTIPPTR
mmetsp:Transcript_19205/g.29113  ORF Transcript_19205/g.29113 Transcript_19205/m.29113 type:complete len:390 (-) Transcript_19205:1020-2189(-)